MKYFLHFFSEAFLLAWINLKLNRTRSILSLLGICIGIFSIVLVFTIVDSLEKGIRQSIRSLGSDVVYIQKWPWFFGGPYPWWKYLARPYPSYEEYQFVEKNIRNAETVAFMFTARRTVRNNKMQAGPVTICGISHSYTRIRNFTLPEGRFFTEREANNGARVIVIGYELAQTLFPDNDALNNYLTVGGLKCKIVGVLAKEGKSIFGLSTDKQIFMPYSLLSRFVNPRSESADPFIICKAKEGVTLEKLMDELEKLLRAKRRIKPSAESSFALNKITLLEKGFDDLFSVITLAGWLIGGFSILVGGFGIANIMFVSVTERIPQIGIQMSLGAPRYFILLQFLSEGIMLSLAGGIVGMLITFTLVFLMKDFSGLTLSISLNNVILGLQLSFLVGLVSSFLPSYQASQLDPVEAMRR